MPDYEEDNMIEVDAAEYDELCDRVWFLNCLEAAGVDNWQGYDDAVDLYKGKEE